jgi:hypothetical protein
LPLLAPAAAAKHGGHTLLRDADRGQASLDHVAKPDGNRLAGAFPVVVA